MPHDDAQHALELEFPATPEELQGSRDALRVQLERWGADERTSNDVVLAVDEACQNIIRHAYCGDPGVIQMRVTREGDEIEVRLRDYAEKSDPACLEQGRALDELRPGGLGTHFIRELMDRAEFIEPPDGRGNLLRMRRRLHPARSDGSRDDT